MSDMPGCRVEVAWETAPRTRPTDLEWTRIDGVTPLRSLTTRRGARIKTAELEAGEATALIDNRSRALDPGNTSSPWAPNVKPRRRIRFVLEPDGEPESVLWTGYIDTLPISWEVGDGTVELAAVDLLGLIAGDTLPPSVLHKAILDSQPVAYWPLTETSGSDADDVVGVMDGQYERPVTGLQELTPFDSRQCPLFKRPDPSDSSGQTVIARPFSVGAAITVSAWFRWKVGPTFTASPSIICLQAGPSPTPLSQGAPTILAIVDNDGSFGVFAQEAGGNGLINNPLVAWNESAPLGLLDGAPHHLAFTLTSAGELHVFADGVEVPHGPWSSGGLVANDITTLDIAAIMSAVEAFSIGWGITFRSSVEQNEAAVGHVAYYDRELSAGEIADIYAAGVRPWEGDTIDQRIDRVLDLAGIDAGDRDLDSSSVLLGPAKLDGQNLVEYLRLLVATEPGGVLFVNGDGQLAFRTALPNEPTPAVTFVGDPDVDAGVPYADLSLGYSLDRVVNIAEVTRENGVTHRAENTDSINEWGPLDVGIETLHRTASGARGAGARLVNRFRNPQTVIDAVELNGRAEGVTPSAALDLEVNDPAQVIARPTGGGDPIDRLVIVESVDHDLDWQTREWTISYGLAEHVVLPLFAWDTPGQGWDESVWPDT